MKSGFMDRRRFVQLSAGAMAAAGSRSLKSQRMAPAISSTEGRVRVTGSGYSWEYVQAEDRFSFRDAQGRLIVSSVMQPAVVVAAVGGPAAKRCSPGKIAEVQVDGERVRLVYAGVNDGARVRVSWRFDAQGARLPVARRSKMA